MIELNGAAGRSCARHCSLLFRIRNIRPTRPKPNRSGIYPAGGGDVAAAQSCKQLRPLELMSRGERPSAYAESFIAGIPANVAKCYLNAALRRKTYHIFQYERQVMQ